MVKKEVKNKEYELLKGISEFLTIKQIAIYRKTSKTAVYKGIYRLLNKGLLRKIGKSYELTDIGIGGLNSFIRLSNLIRLHNLAFKILILNKPRNWELQRSKIVELRTLSKEVDLINNSYQIHNFRNLKIKTTTNSIIFYMPAFYGKDTDDCFNQALDILFKSIPKVENIFKIGLIKDRKANISIISQHYAKLQDSLAKLYKQEDKKLYVRDELGNIWLIADFSFSVSELETIDTNCAKEDMDIVKDFLNDLRKNPVNQSQLMNMIQSVTANQLIFDKNMKSHLRILNRLGKAVENLTIAVKKQNIRENYKEDQKTLSNF